LLRGLAGRSATGQNDQAAAEQMWLLGLGAGCRKNIPAVPAERSVFYSTSLLIGLLVLRVVIQNEDGGRIGTAELDRKTIDAAPATPTPAAVDYTPSTGTNSRSPEAVRLGSTTLNSIGIVQKYRARQLSVVISPLRSKPRNGKPNRILGVTDLALTTKEWSPTFTFP